MGSATALAGDVVVESISGGNARGVSKVEAIIDSGINNNMLGTSFFESR
jgi:hypothetical protein